MVNGPNLNQEPEPRLECGVEVEKQESLVSEANPTVKMLMPSAYNLPTSGSSSFFSSIFLLTIQTIKSFS